MQPSRYEIYCIALNKESPYDFQKKRDRALKQYFYSYAEEEAYADMPPRRLLGKIKKPMADEMVEMIQKNEKEAYLWSQQQNAM